MSSEDNETDAMLMKSSKENRKTAVSAKDKEQQAECMMETPTQRTPFSKLPFGVQWRKTLVSLPRLVPLELMKWTSSEGPQPFIFNMPSRGKYLIPIYVFVPPDTNPDSAVNGLPVIMDYHGGGFVLGSCFEQAPFCAKMCRDLGAVVLCVDYRMGPIDKFPAAIEDGEDVLTAVLEEDSPAGKLLRQAITERLSYDLKKTMKRSQKQAKKQAKAEKKAARKGEGLRPKLKRIGSSSTYMRGNHSDRNLAPPMAPLSRTQSASPLSQEIKDNSSDDGSGSSQRGASSELRIHKQPPTSTPASTATNEQPQTRNSRSSTLSSSSTPNTSGTNTPMQIDPSTLLRPPMLDRSESSTSIASTSSHRSTDYASESEGPAPRALSPTPPPKILDPTKIALSGFSSGGNLILNLALSIPASPSSSKKTPTSVTKPWPSRIPADFPAEIPLLLYYPSFDVRPLPSERPCPPGLPAESGFWSEANDMLMPTYLPRAQAGHPRASPGLADIQPTAPISPVRDFKPDKSSEAETPTKKEDLKPAGPVSLAPLISKDNTHLSSSSLDLQSKTALSTPAGGQVPSGLHPAARMQLVLPELDSLSEQSEIWVKKVQEQGRGQHLLVERYTGMKHGWTQMPEGWLKEAEKESRLAAFNSSVGFVGEVWGGIWKEV